MENKNYENQCDIIQAEAKISKCNHRSFDGGITYWKIKKPVRNVDKYFPEAEVKLKLNFKA